MSQAAAVSMTATFTLQLGTELNARQAVVAKFDGKNPSFACGTSGGKVVLHDSHDPSADPIRFLTINREPTALAAGPITGKKQEALYIGSQTAVLAYNVADNTDLFYKEVGEGVHTMAFGVVGTLEAGVVVVGGNCSIFGYNEEGEDKFWNVAGDNVRAMAVVPWEAGRNALVVGSDDLEIRGIVGEKEKFKVTETAPAVQLAHTLTPTRFIYALNNGTVGVYDGQTRAWRYKSKHAIESVAACDIDFDGVAEVLCGWSNGKFEVRSDAGLRNGEAGFKDKFGAPVSNILSADYRQEGRSNPLVCSFDGECRGYVAVETAQDEVVQEHEQKMLEKLMQERQSLQYEIKQFQKQLQVRAEQAAQGPAAHSALPTSADVKLSCKLRPNAEAKAIELVLSVSGAAIIQGATVTGEVVFGATESLFIASDSPSDTLTGCFKLEKNVAADLRISAMVGFTGADCFQAHELTLKMPKFAMFVPVQDFAANPNGVVTARINERPNRLVMWAQSCFNGFPTPDGKLTNFAARFVSLRDRSQLMVETNTDSGEIYVRGDSMDVVGEVIADLGQYLGLTDLAATADFPEEMAKFSEILSKVEEYNAVRLKLTAEMADSTQFVKALVIKAEDARIQNDMNQMRKMYGSLYEVNRELMGEFMKRSNNHNELLAALKEVNNMIQRAAKFRIGQTATTFVSDCRNAIKTNQMQTLVNIIRTGRP
jgi:Bardet-Biedl syndrome 2 protein